MLKQQRWNPDGEPGRRCFMKPKDFWLIMGCIVLTGFIIATVLVMLADCW